MAVHGLGDRRQSILDPACAANDDRRKVLIFDHCYHGSVDESFASIDAEGNIVERAFNMGAPVPLEATTRVVAFNDLAGLERELAHGDVACVITEPALTNVGIVLPSPASTRASVS